MEDSQVAAALSAQLAERIGSQRFETWFGSQAELSVRGAELVIRAASDFVRDWLRTNFAEDVQACWEGVVGAAGSVEFAVTGNVASEEEAAKGGEQLLTGKVANCGQPAGLPAVVGGRETEREGDAAIVATRVSVTIGESSPRREKFAFGAFVVGASNEYAYRAAELTARGRQQASPILFCGTTGVGKTHLLRAIQQEYRRYHARASALYLTAEQFTTSFVEAIRGSGVPSFRQKCRGAQLLAIDDLQFFVGKQRTIEELLYTIDTLTADGRQLVFSSDRGLAELRALGLELVSRLSGGLVCELMPPEFATRLQIVRQIANEIGIAIDEDVAKAVATQIAAGARELRGALHRLQAMSGAYGEPITRELADRVLVEMARHSVRAVRLADVQKVVCEAFGVEPAQLKSDRKGRALAEPRMLAMWLARKYTRSAWSEIGEFFGRNSHSTVISAHRRVEKLIAEQGEVAMANRPCQVDEAIRRLETALRIA